MKSKAPLVLMEQTVMVLVFALAAAVCVRAFVLSDTVSRTSAAQDAAVLQAQSAAEIYKNCRGDAAAAAERFGGSVKGGVWTVYWDDAWKQVSRAEDASFCLRIRPEKAAARLGSASVKLTEARDGKTLLSFPLAWQEADGHE